MTGRRVEANECRRRAQSESIGVIMLTAVIVLLVGGFGVVYLGAVDDRASGDGPLVDATVNATADRVAITHAGGQSVALDKLEVIVRRGDASERYSMDDQNVNGSNDDAFGSGDRYVDAHDVGDGQLEVLLVHSASNAVIHHAYLDV